jgi:hypothetical protein
VGLRYDGFVNDTHDRASGPGSDPAAPEARQEPGGQEPGGQPLEAGEVRPAQGASRLEPGEQRRGPAPLAAPPSDRYRMAAAETGIEGDASRARGVLLGVLVALFIGLIMVLLGSVLGFTAGLVVAAFFLGQLTAYGVRVGAGPTFGQTTRAWVSVLIALAVLVLVQVVLWLWARAEGGVLDPVAYLLDVYGLLVGVQAVVAAIGAWWGSR